MNQIRDIYETALHLRYYGEDAEPEQCPVCGDHHKNLPRACETGDGE